MMCINCHVCVLCWNWRSPEGNLTVTPTLNQAHPVHKWPLRPGVLVHVNGSHSLNLGRLDSAGADSNVQNHSNLPYACSTMPKNSSASKKKKCARKLKQRRASSLSNLRPDETNQLSRANRIRQMFLNDGLRYHGDTLPGVFHGKSGGKMLSSPFFCKKWIHETLSLPYGKMR